MPASSRNKPRNKLSSRAINCGPSRDGRAGSGANGGGASIVGGADAGHSGGTAAVCEFVFDDRLSGSGCMIFSIDGKDHFSQDTVVNNGEQGI
jgi:hypothetical protein